MNFGRLFCPRHADDTGIMQVPLSAADAVREQRLALIVFLFVFIVEAEQILHGGAEHTGNIHRQPQ